MLSCFTWFKASRLFDEYIPQCTLHIFALMICALVISRKQNHCHTIQYHDKLDKLNNFIILTNSINNVRQKAGICCEETALQTREIFHCMHLDSCSGSSLLDCYELFHYSSTSTLVIPERCPACRQGAFWHEPI